MKEIVKKSNANEDQYKSNIKLVETFDSAKSTAEKTNLEKVKSGLIECEKFLVERAKTDSSFWQVWIRLEYGQRMLRTWSCRWFGRRKKHPQCWETCPWGYVFSKKEVEVFSNGCDQKIFSPLRGLVLSSSSQSSQPGTANSGFLPLCSNIDTCFAFGKPEHWHACCPAMTKQFGFPTSKWPHEQDLSGAVPSCFHRNNFILEAFERYSAYLQ